MKFFKGLQLLCSNPKSFFARLRQIMVIRWTRKRLKALHSGNEDTLWVAYDGMEFPFHPGSHDEQEILYHAFFREWFQATEKLFASHVKPGHTVVDVGANMGFTSLVLSWLVGATGRVHSFEPGRSMFGRLEQLVRRNHLAQVVLHPVGCGAQAEKLTLKIPASSGNASLRLATEMEGEVRLSETVVIEPLDDSLGDQFSQLHFLKIDTEGFEIDVLRGAARTIQRLRPVIFIELSSEYRDSSAASIEWLTSHGYSFPVWPDLDQCRNGDNFFAIPL